MDDVDISGCAKFLGEETGHDDQGVTTKTSYADQEENDTDEDTLRYGNLVHYDQAGVGHVGCQRIVWNSRHCGHVVRHVVRERLVVLMSKMK